MISVTSFLKDLKKPFDAQKKSKSKAKNEGISQQDILDEWENARINGINLHEYIQTRDSQLPNVKSFTRDNKEKFLPTEPDTKLENNTIYLERPIYSLKKELFGFPDKIEIKNMTVNITDHKSFKELRMKSKAIKIGTEFIKPRFFEPIQHIDDSNYWYAVLQLSLYMYIVWENNKHLKVGKLFINHLKTNKDGKLVKEEPIEVPYLRQEVYDLLEYKKLNEI